MTTPLNDLRSILPTASINITPQHPPRPTGRYTFQRVKPGLGNVLGIPARHLQLRKHVIPYDPKSPPQLTRRALFAAAVSAWHAATPEQRAAFSGAASRRNISTFNAFISAYMSSAGIAEGVIWDGGTAIWDGGTAIWVP